MLLSMMATLSFAAPTNEAETETPTVSQVDDDVRRYRNRFTGLGYAFDPAGDAFALRVFGLSAPEGGGIFARGGDLDIGVSMTGQHTLRARTLFGIDVVPGDRVRLAVFTGAGVAPSIPAVLALVGGGDLTGSLVDIQVPVMADLGVSIGSSIGLHARGGLTLTPVSVSRTDGLIQFDQGQQTIEAVLSASFGTRSGSRVNGFRVEAGRMNNAWMLLVGVGG